MTSTEMARAASTRWPVTLLAMALKQDHPSATHWVSSNKFFTAFLSEGIVRELKPVEIPPDGFTARYEKTMANLPVIVTHHVPIGEAWLMRADKLLAVAHVPEKPIEAVTLDGTSLGVVTGEKRAD